MGAIGNIHTRSYAWVMPNQKASELGSLIWLAHCCARLGLLAAGWRYSAHLCAGAGLGVNGEPARRLDSVFN